jgi:DNA-binding GntR family transcriptional regulator
MAIEKTDLPRTTRTRRHGGGLPLVEISGAHTRRGGRATCQWPTARETRDRILETVAIIDSAATSFSAPLLTSADIDLARHAHEAAAWYLSVRDEAGMASSSTSFHQILNSRCPNRRLRELLGEGLALLHTAGPQAAADWDTLARAIDEHAQLMELVQSCPESAAIGQLLRTHWQACV